MRDRVKTSQIYFQQPSAESDNAVAVKLFFDPKKVRAHFGLSSDQNEIDYGFCRMIIHPHHVEFVTEMRRVKRTIEAVRAYMHKKYSVVNAHSKLAVALLELRGVRTMARQIALNKIATKTGCTSYQSYATTSWSL